MTQTIDPKDIEMAAVVLSPTSQQTMLGAVDEGNQSDPIQAGTTPSSSLMASKFLNAAICGALSDMGYEEEAIAKASNRVADNVVEARNIRADEAVVDELLDREKLQLQGIYLNSNEPVLLLEVPKSTDPSILNIQDLKGKLLGILRTRGIRPVRVYVRPEEDVNASHFGFCLLNVVNTDIGSPSMVALLDAAYHNAEWRDYLLVKEAYNGYDLLWQNVALPARSKVQMQSSNADQSVEPEIGAGPELIDDQSAHPEPEEAEAFRTTEKVAAPSLPGQHRDVNAPQEDIEDEEPKQLEHPAFKELREREAARVCIQHPTWSRADSSQGLLDIITTHAAGVKDDEPMSVISRPLESGSDDFEMIEKS